MEDPLEKAFKKLSKAMTDKYPENKNIKDMSDLVSVLSEGMLATLVRRKILPYEEKIASKNPEIILELIGSQVDEKNMEEVKLFIKNMNAEDMNVLFSWYDYIIYVYKQNYK